MLNSVSSGHSRSLSERGWNAAKRIVPAGRFALPGLTNTRYQEIAR
jgi:hypothetical protein